ncbi:MMPL family transporter, partial [Streptomyces nigra]
MRTAPRWARWLVPVVLLLVWLGVGGALGPYAGKLGEVATNDQAAFLPQSAESTQVLEARKAFDQSETLPAIVVWTADGERVSKAQQAEATRAVGGLAGEQGVVGRPSPALPSDDGEALQAVVQLRPDLGDELETTLDAVRDAANGVSGTTAQIAGPAASQADLSDAFAGIDGLLRVAVRPAVIGKGAPVPTRI